MTDGARLALDHRGACSVGNDVTWWKDRDEWMPGSDPPPRLNSEEEQDYPVEDAGDVSNDDSDEFDDSDLPEREPDR